MKESFPDIKVNKKSCTVKIGCFSERFTFGDGQQMNAEKLASEFQKGGQEELSNLDALQKTLKFKKYAK